MRFFGSQMVRWVSMILGVTALGLLEGSRTADASPAGRDVVGASAQSASEGWSGTVIAVFVGAAILVALWRVVLFLLATALVGIVLLGVLMLATGGPPADGARTDGAGPVHAPAVAMEATGSAC